MSAGWPGMTGPTDHVRVGTRSAGEGTCPDYLAAKAHPALWPATSARARKEKLDTFPLGILNAALDEVERNGATAAQAIDLAVEEAAREGKRPHPAALTWVRVGVAQYLAGAARYRDQVQPGDRATVLVRDYWVAREDHRESGAASGRCTPTAVGTNLRTAQSGRSASCTTGPSILRSRPKSARGRRGRTPWRTGSWPDARRRRPWPPTARRSALRRLGLGAGRSRSNLLVCRVRLPCQSAECGWSRWGSPMASTTLCSREARTTAPR